MCVIKVIEWGWEGAAGTAEGGIEQIFLESTHSLQTSHNIFSL